MSVTVDRMTTRLLLVTVTGREPRAASRPEAESRDSLVDATIAAKFRPDPI